MKSNDSHAGPHIHPSHELWYSNGTRRRPLLRGLAHEFCFLSTPFFGTLMLSRCSSAVSVLGACLHILSGSFCYGVSSQFHRREWPMSTEILMAKLDYIGIFVFLAFQMAPVAFLLVPSVGIPLTVLEIIGTLLGSFLVFNTPPNPLFFDWRPSRELISGIFLTLGLAGVVGIPQFLANATDMEALCMWGMLGSGLIGAGIYVSKYPDPVPTIFGYHEVFHAFVCIAGALAYCINFSVICRTGLRIDVESGQ